jgi:hypothetical protein
MVVVDVIKLFFENLGIHSAGGIGIDIAEIAYYTYSTRLVFVLA